MATTTVQSESVEEFVTLQTPAPMTEAKLEQCDDPVEADGQPVYAVAHQHGIIQNHRDERECEGLAVLYVTADGEQAVEMWFRRSGPRDFADAPRVSRATEDELSPTGEAAQKYAPIARKHPEVSQ